MVRIACPARGDIDYYFPEGALDPSASENERLERAFLSTFLAANDAVSFSCDGVLSEGYRMIWAGGAALPVVVSVVHEAGGWRVAWTRFDRELPGRRAGPISHGERVLTATEGESVQGALQRARFWSTRPRIGSGPEGLVWVLEGRAGHRYRAVLLGGGLMGPFADVARALLASAGLTPPPLMLAALTPR